MFTVPVLMLATLLSSTALWSALVDGDMSIETALLRFLLAVPVSALMIVVFRRTMSTYEARSATHPAQDAAQTLSADIAN
ncbi:hypothetical protein BH10ACT8_BH10ACT8_00630 [soil metagenome]|jgi:hypothetical protein